MNNLNTTKQDIENSLLIIFNEIDKIKNAIHSQIKHKHLKNNSDIRDAILDTKIFKYIDEFRVNKIEYDFDKVINTIKDYIDYQIELLIEEEQWN